MQFPSIRLWFPCFLLSVLNSEQNWNIKEFMENSTKQKRYVWTHKPQPIREHPQRPCMITNLALQQSLYVNELCRNYLYVSCVQCFILWMLSEQRAN